MNALFRHWKHAATKDMRKKEVVSARTERKENKMARRNKKLLVGEPRPPRFRN